MLSLEDASIAGDGNDMTRFTFRALDAYGNQRPYLTGDVTLAVAGPATADRRDPVLVRYLRRGRRRASFGRGPVRRAP